MSFLAGRLAATEGAYFLQESKQAVGRLAQKLPPSSSSSASPSHSAVDDVADVLPEILRHSIPIKGTPPPADASLSAASRWMLKNSPSPGGVSPDALNPLRAYVSLPQATFGPKRWQLPNEQPNYSASTANELRQDRYSPMDSEKVKAVIAGYSQIGKAFAAATTIVFGGAAVLFLYTAQKLQLHNTDDIRTKGREVLRPGADLVKERLVPLRTWAESRKNGVWKEKEKLKKSLLSRSFQRPSVQLRQPTD